MSNPIPVTEAEGGASATFDQEEWNAFKITHKKQYADEKEEKMRVKIFLETKEKIAKHNADYEKGLATFKMGINQFADRMVPFRLDNIDRFSIVFTMYCTSGLTLPYMIVFYMMSK